MKRTALAITFCFFSLYCQADTIEMAKDLYRDAQRAKDEQKPIVFFVSADHCPYCEQLREEYLRFSIDDDRLLLRELELDQHHSVINFDGTPTNHQGIAERYNTWLTPTVTFVDATGATLAKPIVGVLTMDFYHYYFEKALQESIALLKARTTTTTGLN